MCSTRTNARADERCALIARGTAEQRTADASSAARLTRACCCAFRAVVARRATCRARFSCRIQTFQRAHPFGQSGNSRFCLAELEKQSHVFRANARKTKKKTPPKAQKHREKKHQKNTKKTFLFCFALTRGKKKPKNALAVAREKIIICLA